MKRTREFVELVFVGTNVHTSLLVERRQLVTSTTINYTHQKVFNVELRSESLLRLLINK